MTVKCIVPPHKLREIARRGDPAERRQALQALQTLALSEQLRGRCEAIGALPLAVPSRDEEGGAT